MFQKLGKQGVSVFLPLHGPPRGGEFTRCYLVDLAPWIAAKSHRQGTLWKSRAASSNDAGFLEAEIAISLWCRGANDHVIQQIDLQNSAGFVDPAGRAKIRIGGARVARGMIVHHDKGAGGEYNRRLKHFARMRERLVDAALADRGNLDQLMFGIQKHDSKLRLAMSSSTR
jgi:hypothetical protein